MPTCEYCSEPVRAQGLCQRHYKRLQRHGDPLHVEVPGPKPRDHTRGRPRRRFADLPAHRAIAYDWGLVVDGDTAQTSGKDSLHGMRAMPWEYHLPGADGYEVWRAVWYRVDDPELEDKLNRRAARSR